MLVESRGVCGHICVLLIENGNEGFAIFSSSSVNAALDHWRTICILEVPRLEPVHDIGIIPKTLFFSLYWDQSQLGLILRSNVWTARTDPTVTVGLCQLTSEK